MCITRHIIGQPITDEKKLKSSIELDFLSIYQSCLSLLVKLDPLQFYTIYNAVQF